MCDEAISSIDQEIASRKYAARNDIINNMLLPEPIQNLITAFERLPGVGPKSASRLAFFLLRAPEDVARSLAEALIAFKEQTDFCPECFNIMLTGRERCEICDSRARD